MSEKAMASPRVFISYAHESSDHERWVRRLADDLVRNGVRTTLDQWDLRVGDDLVAFMTDGIERATHVVLVCTDAFGKKASARTGGVGFEQTELLGGLLLAPEASPAVIPVLRAGTPSVALPSWLRARLWADFTDDAVYPAKLEELLRRLFDAAPQSPPLGPPPAFAAGPAARQGGITAPRAWILVAGTGRAALAPKLSQTATAVGERLADAGYGLVTGGWPGVDDLAARAFARRLEQAGAAVEDRLTQVVPEHKLPGFAAGNLILVKPHSKEEWTKLVGAADAVVVAGGIGGAGKTAAWGHRLGRPVFPLADTGGDAADLYLEALREADAAPVAGVPRERFMMLAREAPGVAGALITVLDAWTAARRAPSA